MEDQPPKTAGSAGPGMPGRNPVRHPPKTAKAPPKKRSSLARFFGRGLIVLAPAIVTIVIFGLLFQMVGRYITGPINSVIYWTLEGNDLGWKGLARLGIDPYDERYLDPKRLPARFEKYASRGYTGPEFEAELATYRAENKAFFHDVDDLGINAERLRTDVQRVVPPYLGVALSFLLVLWLGYMMGGFVGRQLVQRVDQALHKIPVINAVYPYSKQLVEFFFAEKQLEFDTVVCVPYPSEHVWSIGFVTSSAMKTLCEASGQDLVTVFVPSSPMPMTGYTTFIPAHMVVQLPISVDEALRITMSGGVLIPPREKIRSHPLEVIAQAQAAESQAAADEAQEPAGSAAEERA